MAYFWKHILSCWHIQKKKYPTKCSPLFGSGRSFSSYQIATPTKVCHISSASCSQRRQRGELLGSAVPWSIAGQNPYHLWPSTTMSIVHPNGPPKVRRWSGDCFPTDHDGWNDLLAGARIMGRRGKTPCFLRCFEGLDSHLIHKGSISIT